MEAHVLGLAAHLARMQREGAYTDVTVRCGGAAFELHAAVLIYGSEFFAAALRSDMRERRAGVVELVAVGAGTFARVVQWLYTGLVEPADVGEALAVLQAAGFLAAAGLEEECRRWLHLNVAKDTCIRVWLGLRGMPRCEALTNRVLCTVGHHLPSVALADDFLELDLELARELLGADELGVPSELCVYYAAVRWAQRGRGDALLPLLGAVRVALLPDGLVARTARALLIVRPAPPVALDVARFVLDDAPRARVAQGWAVLSECAPPPAAGPYELLRAVPEWVWRHLVDELRAAHPDLRRAHVNFAGRLAGPGRLPVVVAETDAVAHVYADDDGWVEPPAELRAKLCWSGAAAGGPLLRLLLALESYETGTVVMGTSA
jgi:hypothetical protein